MFRRDEFERLLKSLHLNVSRPAIAEAMRQILRIDGEVEREGEGVVDPAAVGVDMTRVRDTSGLRTDSQVLDAGEYMEGVIGQKGGRCDPPVIRNTSVSGRGIDKARFTAWYKQSLFFQQVSSE